MSDDDSTQHDLDAPDPTLAALFAKERARDDAPLDAKARIADRLERSLGSPGGSGEGGNTGNGGGAGPGGSAISLKALPLLAALAVGGVVGSLVTSALQAPRVVVVDRATPGSNASPAESTPTVEPALGIRASTSQETAPPASASSRTVERTPDADKSLAAERAILDVARTALGRGDGVHALEAVDRHAREYPHGLMTEEREALAVQAQAKLGRSSEAAARGAQFKRRYPNSVLLPVINAALESTTGGRDSSAPSKMQ